MALRSVALAIAIFFIFPLIVAVLGKPVIGFVGLWLVVVYWVFRHSVVLGWPTRKQLSPVLVRTILVGVLLGVVLWLLKPEYLLAFPLHMPDRYILVMLVYPFLSVLPQEILFRCVFWHLFSDASQRSRVFWNAAAFAVAHSIFLNPVAVMLSFVGGLFLARTYEQHRHLGLVCVEHTLYGWLVFTIGWGIYFYHGAVGMWGA
ncbi:MAG: type II CAAX prenyl endopeptidase Rce1 family protein [Holosporales bacterium]|jgi:hypothetical protein